MREIARNIARENMKRAGINYHINKKRPFTGKSFFSDNWRKYVNYNPNMIIVHHKKRVKTKKRRLSLPFKLIRGVA